MLMKVKILNKVPKKNNFKNVFFNQDTLSILRDMPSNYFQVMITSPPYFLKKEYEDDISYKNYLNYHSEVIRETKRVLKKDGSVFWNVAQTFVDGETIPLGAIFYNIFKEYDYYLKNWIIWKFEGGETPRTRLFGRYENILWFIKNKENYVFNVDDIRVPAKWSNDKRCRDEGKNPEDFWNIDYRTNENRLKEIEVNISKLKKRLLGKTSANNQAWLDDTFNRLESQIQEILIENKNEKNLNTNIWLYDRVVNINKKEKIKHPKKNVAHPCQFPEALISRIIRMSTSPKDLVLDIYSGSGTTCKVAQDLNRGWVGIEKEIDYCEIAKYRMENI